MENNTENSVDNVTTEGMSEHRDDLPFSYLNARRDDLPLSYLHDWVSRFALIFFAAVFPMLVGARKYANITAFKGMAFNYAFGAVVGLLLLTLIMNVLTRYSTIRFPGVKKIFAPTYLADAALIAFMVLEFGSAIFARTSFSSDPDVRRIAWVGQSARNNGFWIQLAYTVIFFVISKRLIAKFYDAYIFVFGGFIFSVACQLHLYGVDIYNIASVNGQKYSGPFFEKRTEFMGPIGNVNLASYVITVACIAAAGLYINYIAGSIKNDTDAEIIDKGADKLRLNKTKIAHLATLFAFAFLMWAELNINTDAGLVGLAVGFLLMLVVFPSSLAHLGRIFVVYSVAGLVVAFNKWAVDVIRRGENFGRSGQAGLLVFLLFGAAALVVYFLSERCGFKASGKTLRICGTAVAVACLLLSLTYIYVNTTPMEHSAPPPVSDAEALKEYKKELKEAGIDNPIKELGQILHGNFDDRFGHNRMFTWKRTVSLLKMQPVSRTIFGNGPDNFARTLKLYIGDEAKLYFGGRNLDKAHNEFLDVLINNGVIGLLAYLVFFGLLLYYAFRLAPGGGVAPVFGVAITTYLAHAFFGYQLPIQSPIMWVMIGLCAAFIRAEAKDIKREKQISG